MENIYTYKTCIIHKIYKYIRIYEEMYYIRSKVVCFVRICEDFLLQYCGWPLRQMDIKVKWWHRIQLS